MRDDDQAHDDRDLAYLKLLRDEGLRLLAAFKRIDDPKLRDVIIRLTETIADASA